MNPHQSVKNRFHDLSQFITFFVHIHLMLSIYAHGYLYSRANFPLTNVKGELMSKKDYLRVIINVVPYYFPRFSFYEVLDIFQVSEVSRV